MASTETRIVIVGGGVFGLSAAFHLAGAGYKDIVLFDKGPIASGTTPHAAGQTAYLTSTPDGLPLANYCLEFYENFERRTGYPVHFNQVGSLRVALTDAYLHDLENHMASARRLGHRIDSLDAAAARKMAPAFEPGAAKGIIHIPRDGYVDPKAVAVAYAAAARDLGVTIHTRNRVKSVELADGQVTAVVTDTGRVEAQWVVVAAGAWTRQFARRLGLEVKAVPVRHQSFITAPLREALASQPVVRIIEPQIYVRAERGGLLVGGYGYRPASFDMDDLPEDFEVRQASPDPVAYARLRAAATPFFPALRTAIVAHEQVGLPTMTPDATPIVSEIPGAKRLLFATGCQVGGIAISPAIGRLVADAIIGRESQPPLANYAAGRFGANYADGAQLRAACEEIYGRLYLTPH